MRKTLKKAMSVVLSAALVLSLGNVGFSKEASAAEGDVYLQWDGSWVPTIWVDSEIPGSNSGEFTVAPPEEVEAYVDSASWNMVLRNMDLSAMDSATLTIAYTSSEGTKLSEVSGLIQTSESDRDSWWEATPANTATDDGSVYSLVLTNDDLTNGNLYICPNAAGITVTQVKISDAAAAEDTYTAALSYTDSAWGNGDWGASDSSITQVALTEGSASYSVSTIAEESGDGAAVFVVDIEGFNDAAIEAGYAIELTDLAITCGDEALVVDLSKVATGDIEENGNYRIEIYNLYGPTVDDSPIDLAKLVCPNTITVDFTLNITEAAAEPVIDFTMTLNSNCTQFGWGVTLDPVIVTGYGEYTTTLTAENDLDDINNIDGAVWIESTLTEEPTGFDVVAKTMTVGDTEYDWSSTYLHQDGDYYRLGVVNVWGDVTETKSNPFYGTVIPVAAGDEITFTFEVVAKDASADDAAEEEEDETVALNEYHAYLGFQTAVWNYRDQWASKESTEANVDGYDFDTMAVFGGAATDPSQVVIENATITENGEYTVSMTGLDLSEDQSFNMLYVSTDIPSTMSGVEVTDAVITLDDATYEMAVLPVKNDIANGKTDGDFAGYMFMAIDKWGTYDNLDVLTCDADGVPNYTMPQNTVSISFKISGVDFAYTDNAGAKKTVDGVTYKVTKNGNAKVVKVKDQKKVTIKNKVKINGTSYKVTSLKKGVFSGKSKVANVTLGKNIKKIPANTFKKCTSLKKLTVNAKLTSVSKNAFKGCKKTIKVSGKKVAANVKTLKASGYKKFTK